MYNVLIVISFVQPRPHEHLLIESPIASQVPSFLDLIILGISLEV